MPRVLITREHAWPLDEFLSKHGVDSYHVPMLRLVPTDIRPPHDRPGSVLVTSASAPRLCPTVGDVVAGAWVVAVGPKTASALRDAGIRVNAVGRSGGVEALELLHGNPRPWWFVGAEVPSPRLVEALSEAGVLRWSVYRSIPYPSKTDLADIDAVVFTSGRSVEAFVRANGVPDKVVVVLGQSTAEVAREMGFRNPVVAPKPTMEDLAKTVAALF